MPCHINPLAHHDRSPTGFSKQFVIFAKNLTIVAKQFNFFGQALWDRHVAAVVPKRAVVPAGRIVMQD